MLIFIMILFFSILAAGIFFFYLGGKDYQVIKEGGKAKKWSESTQRRFSSTVRITCKMIALGSSVFITIPMIQDIPNLLTNNYEIVEGTPSYSNQGPYGTWFLRQSLTIKGTTVVFYLHDYLPEDYEYKVYYLKHSHYAIKVINISN